MDCTGEIPIILRPGGVSKEELEAVVGKVDFDAALINMENKPKSPGMKYAHYAPSAPMYLMNGERQSIQKLINEKEATGPASRRFGNEGVSFQL